MPTITAVLTADHRSADELFAAAVKAAEESDWSACRARYDGFLEALKRHMRIEEEVLFPAFERASRISSGGPTWVMRQEHRQMLDLLEVIAAAIDERNDSGFRAMAQSFTDLMAGHSMKEERVLYPLCDRTLPELDGEKLGAMLSRPPH